MLFGGQGLQAFTVVAAGRRRRRSSLPSQTALSFVADALVTMADALVTMAFT